MRNKARFVCSVWLVAVVACSDDGLTVQGQNSSSTGEDSANNGTGSPPTTDSQGVETGTGPVPGDTSGPLDTGPLTTDGTEDTGASDTESTATDGTTGGTTGSTEGSTEGSTTGDVCEPITHDPSGIGTDCSNGGACLPGYTCQPFVGFVLQETCQILCTMDCECPAGLSCVETSDKVSAWYQCG
jgi:hypothetical protein